MWLYWYLDNAKYARPDLIQRRRVLYETILRFRSSLLRDHLLSRANENVSNWASAVKNVNPYLPTSVIIRPYAVTNIILLLWQPNTYMILHYHIQLVIYI